MIKELKKKFIINASAVFIVFTLVILAATNLFNYYSTTKYLDGILNIIHDNGGRVPDIHDGFNGGGDWQRPITKDSLSEVRFFTVRINSEGEVVSTSLNNLVTEEEAVEYALNAYNSNKSRGYMGNYRYKVKTAAEMKSGQPPVPPESGISSGVQSGDISQESTMQQQYQESQNPAIGQTAETNLHVPPSDETLIIFCDCYEQKTSMLSGLALSGIIGVVGLTVVIILLAVFSSKAVNPIIESIGAQREFITNVSHEIKTPLTVISGNADILKMNGVESEWLDSIQTQVKKTRALVDDLVLLSQMNEENIVLSFEVFDVSALLAGVTEKMRSLAIDYGFTLSEDITPEIYCNANISSLSELFSVLFDNAFKYCEKNGEITVSLASKGKKLVLCVGNSYTEPMREEELDKLFDRYYRARKTVSNADGSGIGLSIAKAITVAHGGKICAACSDGRFSITAELGIVVTDKKLIDESKTNTPELSESHISVLSDNEKSSSDSTNQ